MQEFDPTKLAAMVREKIESSDFTRNLPTEEAGSTHLVTDNDKVLALVMKQKSTEITFGTGEYLYELYVYGSRVATVKAEDANPQKAFLDQLGESWGK